MTNTRAERAMILANVSYKMENFTKEGIERFQRLINNGFTISEAFDQTRNLHTYILDDEDWSNISDGYLDDEDNIQADNNNEWLMEYIDIHPEFEDTLYYELSNVWGYR